MRKMSRRDTPTQSMSAYHRSAVQFFNGAGSGKIRKQCGTSLALDGVPHPQALVIDAKAEIGTGAQCGDLLPAELEAQEVHRRGLVGVAAIHVLIGNREGTTKPFDFGIDLVLDATQPRQLAAALCFIGKFDQHRRLEIAPVRDQCVVGIERSEEHTSELQSLMRISYAVFCLNKKKRQI